MRFFRAIYPRLETTSYEREKNFPQNGRFFRVIYGRLETGHIWLSETHMRFFRAIYWRLETTLGIYCHLKTTSYQCFNSATFFYGRSFRLIYGRLETPPIWLSKTHMRFFRAIYRRLETTIYGRLETAPIWLSETHMRFFRAIYRRLETTLYESFQTFICRRFTNTSYGRFITLYVRCVITAVIRSRNTCFISVCKLS